VRVWPAARAAWPAALGQAAVARMLARLEESSAAMQIERRRWQGSAAAGLTGLDPVHCEDQRGMEGSFEVEVVSRRQGLRSLDLSSWTVNSPPAARSGLNDAHRWYGVGAGDLARACWLDFQAVAATPLLPDLAYSVGLSRFGRGVPEATDGGQQRRRRTPKPATAVCSDLDVWRCCAEPDLAGRQCLPKVWLAAAGPSWPH
jgi:hypothetical protein